MSRSKNSGVLWQLFWLMICALVRIMPVYADEMLDPTKPEDAVLPYLAGNAELGGVEALHLSGVQLNGKHSVAIVNNTVLRLGQAFQGYTVKAISRTRVLLSSPSHHSVSLPVDLKDYRIPANTIQTLSGAERQAITMHKSCLHTKKSYKESACDE